MNPYETSPVPPKENVPQDACDNSSIAFRSCTTVLLLMLMGGTSASLGLMLAVYSLRLIFANVGTHGEVGFWAFIAFPIGIIAMLFSCVLLTFGLLGVRDASKSFRSGLRLHKQHQHVANSSESQ